jgi:folate-dependent phosphoribosylglycinamide formyltransferase PurN
LNLSEEQKINRTLELIETSKQIFFVKQELKQKRSDPNKVLTGDQKSELFLLTDGIEITQSKVLSGITATMQEGFNKGTAKFVVENAEAIGMLLYDTSIVQLVDKDAVARNRARVEGIAYLVTHLDELPEQIATDFKNDLKAAKQKIDAGDLEGGMKIFGELTANLYSSVLNTGAGALKLSAGITKAIGKVGKKAPIKTGTGIEIEVSAAEGKIADAVNQGPHDRQKMRELMEERFGVENVTATSNSKNPLQSVNNSSDGKVKVITDANGGKAVHVEFNDPVTGELKTANVPYNSVGLPIFDDHAKFVTTIDHSKSYDGQMRQATRDLRDAIDSGKIDPKQFTDLQLKQIQAGRKNIKDFTWHHNADTGNMQLLPLDIHDPIKHIGQNALKGGK